MSCSDHVVGIDRHSYSQTITISDTPGNGTRILYASVVAGNLLVMDTIGFGTLYFYGYASETSTQSYNVVDDTGTSVSRPVSGSEPTCLAIPDECAGLQYLEIVSDTSGTATLTLKG